MFVTDDIPFLVDTVRMVLDRHGLGIHLLVYPTLTFLRDGDHEIVRLDDTAPGDDVGESRDPNRVTEAWVLIELDRCTPDLERRLEADVVRAIHDVHRVVADFEEMRDRMRSIADDDPLLQWLGGQHFVLLGAASFDRLIDADGAPTLRLQPGDRARRVPARCPPRRVGSDHAVEAWR